MVTFGLDKEYANKVYSIEDGVGKWCFSSYALIGLNNFYHNNHAKFKEELSAGPPSEYRWLAWYFMS